MTKEEILKEAIEEIIDPISAMRKRLGEGEQLDGVYAITLSNSAKYLKDIAENALNRLEYATQEKQGWVKTSYRLPDYGEKVNVYFQHIDNILMAYLAKGKDNEDVWVVYFKDGECLNAGEHAEVITNWMPLPQKPEV